MPAVEVEVTDTTGAGDAFNSGFAVALAEGRDIVEAVRFGVVLRGHRLHPARRHSQPAGSGRSGRALRRGLQHHMEGHDVNRNKLLNAQLRTRSPRWAMAI